MKNIARILVFCGGLAAAMPFTAVAEEFQAGAQRTPEVVVSATRTERDLFDVPSSVSVVSAKQIERQPRGTIAEQLQDIPGIQVTDGGMGGGAKRVSIRGESAARTLVLIDGMKISEQKSMDGSMIMLSPLDIERIEVIKGPASVLYGSEAIGGVVNIITKKGGTRPIQATLATTYDSSDNSITPYGSVYGSYNGFNYRISGDYTDADDKRGGSGKIDDTSYLRRSMSAYVDYTWDSGKVGVGFDNYWSNISIPGQTSPGFSIDMHLPKWKRDKVYAFAEFEKLSDYLQKVRLSGFFQKTKKDFWNDILVTSRDDISPMMYMERTINMHPYTKNTQETWGFSAQTDWTFGEDHYVIAGLDYLYDDLEAKDVRGFSIKGQRYHKRAGALGPRITMVDRTNTYIYEGFQQTTALFAQDEWTFLPDWTLTAGVRQTWVKSALTKTTDPALKESTSEDSHLVASAGLVYSGLEDWRFRANYSQGYRFPMLNQLYIGTTHGSQGRAYPNADLKPEKSNNFELGVRFDNDSYVADLSLFYTLSDDYIANRRIAGTSDTIFENVNKAKTYGSELVLSYTYEPWHLTPYTSGSYMRRIFDSGRKTAQTGNPMWMGRTGLRYDHDISPEVNIHTDIFARYASHAKEESTVDVEQYAGWGTLNLAVGARFGEERNLFVDLNLNNLLDKKYRMASSTLEEPGFHAVLRAGVEF